MENLIGIALVASILYSCNGANNTDPANDALRAELTQARHETEILKLRHELDLVRATPGGVELALPTVRRDSDSRFAYLDAPFSADPRRTEQVDNEWTDHETDSPAAYETGHTTPTAETPALETEPIADPPAAEAKKGMSTTVKGALIGAGVGAVTGAVIAKDKRVKGAVVGAVVGAGAGAGTGIIIDKKKEKKAESTPFLASNTFLK